jgi:hypothetical protein
VDEAMDKPRPEGDVLFCFGIVVVIGLGFGN